MENKIRIALAGLKGGIGKTTLSMVLGSILKESYGKKVCYVDSDYFQYPITAQNQREQMFFERHNDLVRQVFEERGVDFDTRIMPPIFKMNEGFERSTSPEVVEKEHPDCDVFIYDFMGSQGFEDTYMYLTKMDYIILPTVIDTVNAQPTYYWMKGVNFGKKLVVKNNGEIRTKKIYLLFNGFNDENCDFELKSWLEDQARSFGIVTLQNPIKHFSGVARDVTSITEENKDFFVSLYLQPSQSYCEMTNVLQAIEEFLFDAGIIAKKDNAPRIIEDPLEFHKVVLEDLKSQLDELGELADRTNNSISELSEKHREILETYQRLCSMSIDDIKAMWGRKAITPTEMSLPDEVDQEAQEGEEGSVDSKEEGLNDEANE